MARRTNSKDVRAMLDTVLSHAMFHMIEVENQITALKLKRDGTDKPEDMKTARILTLVLTLLNDSIHSAHGYAAKVFDSRMVDRYIKNQKLALDNKLVNPCLCSDCKERGYVQHEVAMERTDNKSEHPDATAKSEQQN